MPQNYFRPIIENKIYISPALSLDGPYRSATDEYKTNLQKERRILKHVGSPSSELTKYYRQAFSVISAYPRKSDLREASENVFLFLDPMPTYPTNIVNTVLGHRELLKAIESERVNSMLIIGNRGAGKTLYLNYLVNTESDRFYYDHKLVWYRVDVSLLHEQNILLQKPSNIESNDIASQSSSKKSKRYTLEDFLNVHIPYITYKFRDGYEIFEEIWEDKEDRIKELSNQHFKNIPPAKLGMIFPQNQIIEEFKKAIKADRSITDPEANLIQVMKKDIRDLLSQKRLLMASEHLAYVIFSYLRENGFRLLLILDGADNLDYYRHSLLYDHLMRELREFVRHCYKLEIEDKVMIALRSETFEHLKEKKFDLNSRNFETFFVNDTDPQKCLDKRADVACNAKGNYFLNRKDLAIKNIKSDLELKKELINEHDIDLEQDISTINTDFFTTLSSILSELKKAVKDIIPNQSSRQLEDIDKTFFELMYNGNLRDLLFNCINIYLYKRLFIEKKPFIAQRMYVLLEGQLLNGNLYLISKEDENDVRPGQIIPNIFYFDQNKLQPRRKNLWHGLCFLRMLQLIKQNEIDKESVIKKIANTFNYEEEIIKSRFSQALSSGLIEGKCSTETKKCMFRLTKKGDFIMYFAFFDVSIFYYCAIDTPIPKEHLDYTQRIQCHSNINEYWADFIEACIKTSITFSKLIKNQHEKEMKSVNGEKEEKTYSLPSYFPDRLIDGMMAQISYLKKNDPERYNSLRDAIRHY